jgi:hypothetical protein
VGILQSLYRIKNNDLGGLTYPLTFSAGKNAPRVLCYWLNEVRAGTLIVPPGVSSGRICNG